MRPLAVLFCLLAATACDENSPTAPTVALNEAFTLAPREAVSVDGAGFHLQFVRVSDDSRCPADALCVHAGDAVVHVRVADPAGRADYELHTADAARAAATHRQTRIELTELQPYPFSGRPISADDYRATLRVTRP